MDKEEFYTLARQPYRLNNDTLAGLRKLTEDFPYFHAAWVLYLKNLKELNDPEFETALKKAAPLLPDRKQLYRFLHSRVSPPEFSIDMDKSGIRILNQAVEEEDGSRQGEDLIDRFLSSSPGSKKHNILSEENHPLIPDYDVVAKSLAENDEFITETLANIYAEQKKYDKAQEAFRKLSLKYPEKNSYFATRIEEIENLKNI